MFANKWNNTVNNYRAAAEKIVYDNSPYSRQFSSQQQEAPVKNSMIERIKSSIQTYIPSSIMSPSIKSQLNSFFDLLGITMQIDSQSADSNNVTTIQQIKDTLNDISQYIKGKVTSMQLTGLAKQFFESLAAFIVMFAYIFGPGGVANRRGNVIYHGDGGKYKRTRRRRKHKQSRRR
jgi:hypothetical protein